MSRTVNWRALLQPWLEHLDVPLLKITGLLMLVGLLTVFSATWSGQDNPYKCLPIFSLFKDEIHLILTILHKTIEELERVQRTSPLDPMQLNKVFSALEMINKVLCDPNKLSTLNYFSKWDIDFNQSYRVLVTIEEKSPYIHTLCGALKRNKIPMQIYNGKEFVNDDFDPEQEDLEIGSSGISP